MTRLLLLTAFFPTTLAFAARFPRYSYEADFNARFAEHLHQPIDPAAEKLGLSLQQNARLSPRWEGAFGFSAWYDHTAVDEDKNDLRARNAYVQYRSRNWQVKIGNQQVVWGEAFGFFFSDIVNPKDLRNGTNGDLSDLRLQTPMLNAKFIHSNISLQGLYVAQPTFNILPAPGNDYAWPLVSTLGVQSLRIDRERSLPIQPQHGEYGLRASSMFGRTDLSFFYFDYFDRNPWYTVTEAAYPARLTLAERHSRVKSLGLTATADLDGLVLRMEGVRTFDRVLSRVTTVSGLPILHTVALSHSVYVLEADLPTWKKYNIGLQWAQDILEKAPDGLLREKTQSMASLRVQRPLLRTHNAEVLYTRDVSDSGDRLTFDYSFPFSDSLESHVGYELYSGPGDSEFGRIHRATRAYLTIEYFIKR